MVINICINWQIFPAWQICSVGGICDCKLEIRLCRPRLLDQMLHARQSLGRAAPPPAEVVEAELDEAEVGLVGGNLFGDEVLRIVSLLAAGSEVVRVGLEVPVNASGIPSIGVQGRRRLGRLINQPGRAGGLGLIRRDGAAVWPHEPHGDLLLLEPLPDAVSPSPVALAAVRYRVPHDHDPNRDVVVWRRRHVGMQVNQFSTAIEMSLGSRHDPGAWKVCGCRREWKGLIGGALL